MQKDNGEKTDPSHTWVWDLKKGEKVWIAIEESIAHSEQYYIDFHEQTGPYEYERIEEIFVPHEMEVVNNWKFQSGEEESHVIGFQFSDPKKYGRLKFACQCNTRDLLNLFSVDSDDKVISTRTFKTKEECESFCRNYLALRYSIEQCDSLLDSLQQMVNRIKVVKQILSEEEIEN